MSGLNIGSTAATKVYIGSTEATKVYVGTSLAWSAAPSIPAPISHFDWHEGSGATTTSLVSAHSLSVASWSEHDGLGAIGPAGTITTWTWAIDFNLTAAGGDVTLCSTEGPYFFLNFDAGRPGPYPDQTTDTFPIGTPTMLVIVVTPTLCKVYIDGVEKGSFAGSYSMNPVLFKIQKDSHPPGQVASFRYWGSALTAGQVAAL